MGEAVDISFFIKDIQNLPATNPTAPNVASVIIRASMRPAIIVAVDADADVVDGYERVFGHSVALLFHSSIASSSVSA